MKRSLCLLIIFVVFSLSVNGFGRASAARRQNSPADKANLQQRAEEFADRFIQRWHQTLDLQSLANEMFVSSAQFKPVNEKLFYAWCIMMTAPAGDEETTRPEIEKAVDEKVMKECLLAFSNMLMLAAEYEMAFGKTEDSEDAADEFKDKFPMGIARELEKLAELNLSSPMIGLEAIKKIITQVNNVSAAFRKKMTPALFDSAGYKSKMKKRERQEQAGIALEKKAAREAGEDYTGEPFEILRNFEMFGIEISNNAEMYFLRRRGRVFLLVEEQGQLKLLSVR
jgi:hypothetical protein